MAETVKSWKSYTWGLIHRHGPKTYPKTCHKIILRHILSQFTKFVLGGRNYCLSNALARPSNQFFPSVCVFVNRSVVERLRPQFFTDYHEILHAAQKCGRFVDYCL